mmetsp:Transcript_45021/g.141737  ORF Transcript_45021/g.141737 Transcript_45021/m.141737 type:complete len:243 (-) Transcript_45021:421-1149(-)
MRMSMSLVGAVGVVTMLVVRVSMVVFMRLILTMRVVACFVVRVTFVLMLRLMCNLLNLRIFAEERLDRNLSPASLDQFVLLFVEQSINDPSSCLYGRGVHHVHLVQHDHVGRFDLLGKELRHSSSSCTVLPYLWGQPRHLPQPLLRHPLLHELTRVHHRNDLLYPRIEGRLQSSCLPSLEVRLDDRGLRNPRQLHKDVVELVAPRPPCFHKLLHRAEELVADGTAGTAILQLDGVASSRDRG